MEIEEEEIKEVYARAGLALAYSQTLEQNVAMLVILHQSISPKRRKMRLSYEQLLSSTSKKTLGQLIRDLRQAVSLPSGAALKLQIALDARNHLVHHFFWEKTALIGTSEGRQSLYRLLTATQEGFDSVSKMILRMRRRVLAILRLSEKQLRLKEARTVRDVLVP